MSLDKENKEKTQAVFEGWIDILKIADSLADNLPIASITEKVLSQVLIGIDKAMDEAQSETCRRWTRAEVLELIAALNIKINKERKRQ